MLDTTNPFKLTCKTQVAHYYVQGGISKATDSMRITLMIEPLTGNQKSRSKVDLYEDKQVERLCKEASDKLGISKGLLEDDISKLTDLLEGYRDKELLKSAAGESDTEKVTVLTVQERAQIEDFASKPKLIERLGDLLGKAGIVGKKTTGYSF